MEINYPRTLADNTDFRIALIAECVKDPLLAKQVYDQCAKDLIFWIELFCWTKDPRPNAAGTDIIPFICYDAYQNETLLEIESAIDNQHDELFDKSRDMGLSWMVIYVFQHKWLFEDGSDFKLGSRKEDYVDQPGDIDTLFEKLRFNLQRQPDFLLPKGFKWDRDSTYMKMLNPVNGNAIVGESANPNFGSGGRRKAILLDEYSKWDKGIDKAAWTSTADVTRCRIPVSTPYGSGNKFATLAAGTQEKIKKMSVHWTLHPTKAEGAYYVDGGERILIGDHRKAFELWKAGVEVRSPWYDAECERRSKQDIAQELDIDYLSSGRPYFDLKALAIQRPWVELKPKRVGEPIPYGSYVVVELMDVDNKVTAIESERGWLRLFERPSEDREYVIADDSSEGLAKGDESFGVVRDKITRNVVGAFNGLWKPEILAQKSFLVEKYFRITSAGTMRVLNAPENNNMGYATTTDLVALGSNVYWSEKEVVKDGRTVMEPHKPGFTTTSASRPLILNQGDEDIRKQAGEVRDPVIIQQMKTFVHNAKSGKAEADGDFLDDGVLAWLIAGYVITTKPYKPRKEGSTNYGREERQRALVKQGRNGGFQYAG